MKIDQTVMNALVQVFTLDPIDTAKSAQIVADEYISGNATLAGALAWADFDDDWRFVRGGITDVNNRSTKVFSAPNGDNRVNAICKWIESDKRIIGQISVAENLRLIYWILPYNNIDERNGRYSTSRCIAFSEGVFSDVLQVFNGDAGLTAAETRLLFQLVSGVSLKTAAEVDGLSFETKRAHLKNASAKLNLNGQVDVVRRLMGQLVHLLLLCEIGRDGIEVAETFTRDVLPRGTSLATQPTDREQRLRIWDVGPRNGRPVLLCHGFLFPFLFNSAATYLEELGLRLMVPVRRGYLDDSQNQAYFDDGLLFDRTLADLLQFSQMQFDEPPYLIGHGAGCFYAMHLIDRAPFQFAGVSMLSLTLLPDSLRKASEDAAPSSELFYLGLSKIATDAKTFSLISREYQRTVFSSADATRSTLRQLFSGNSIDLDLLNGIGSEGAAFEWYRRLHRHSLLGNTQRLRANGAR